MVQYGEPYKTGLCNRRCEPLLRCPDGSHISSTRESCVWHGRGDSAAALGKSSKYVPTGPMYADLSGLSSKWSKDYTDKYGQNFVDSYGAFFKPPGASATSSAASPAAAPLTAAQSKDYADSYGAFFQPQAGGRKKSRSKSRGRSRSSKRRSRSRSKSSKKARRSRSKH